LLILSKKTAFYFNQKLPSRLLLNSKKRFFMTRKKTSNVKTAFVHTVFFWLKNPDNAAEKAQLEAGLRSISEIDTIKTAYIGQPAATNRGVIDASYSFSITFIFANEAAEKVYQTHPTHLAFVDSCKHLWEKVIVYDAVG
jgi:hypothetical protein